MYASRVTSCMVHALHRVVLNPIPVGEERTGTVRTRPESTPKRYNQIHSGMRRFTEVVSAHAGEKFDILLANAED